MMSLEKEKTDLDFGKWINEKPCESLMFYYWQVIIDLLVLMLQFVLSDRGRNFNLYVDVLTSSMKYIFVSNQYN